MLDCYMVGPREIQRVRPPFFCVAAKPDGVQTVSVILRVFADSVLIYDGVDQPRLMKRHDLHQGWGGLALTLSSTSDQDALAAAAVEEAVAKEAFLAAFEVVDDFMTAEECDEILGQAESGFGPSVVGSERVISLSRTSQSAYLNAAKSPLQPVLFERARQLVNDASVSFEDLQAVRYGPGQTYQCHYDVEMGAAQRNPSIFGWRTWTLLVYLNDDFDGGETWFPLVDRSIVPRRGAALCFKNRLSDGSENPFALHSGMPVVRGVKQALNLWSR